MTLLLFTSPDLVRRDGTTRAQLSPGKGAKATELIK
jgi:hypothetical protein